MKWTLTMIGSSTLRRTNIAQYTQFSYGCAVQGLSILRLVYFDVQERDHLKMRQELPILI